MRPETCRAADRRNLCGPRAADRYEGVAIEVSRIIHWHYKREKQKGTLELTLFPAHRRLWAKVAEGRKAPWIDLELPPLRREVEKKLKVLPR